MSDESARFSADVMAHLRRVRTLPEQADPMLQSIIRHNSTFFTARAPGRLDVMGGIADYSGSLVLQLPIAEAALVSVQPADDGRVVVVSCGQDSDARQATIGRRQWADCLNADYQDARQILGRDASSSWASYVLGPVLVLVRERKPEWDGGLRILLDSHVPEGKGVSSSAAVEVATMQAFAESLRIELGGEELARLCQVAENLVVGAPCGIMDQMTSAVGRENQLLALRCQPATVEGYLPIPPIATFWGIDSGVRHAVSGSDYSSVRCAAFMGYRIIADARGLPAKPSDNDPHVMDVDDPHWNGYLANISPEEFRNQFEALLPEQVPGAEFLARYRGTTDRVTRVEAGHSYPVRQSAAHPIQENVRVGRFRDLLAAEVTENGLREMGRLMLESHDSYTACGLGSDRTDLLVELVREAGASNGLYGARITGGGSGGTVAVLGRSEASRAVDSIAEEYFSRTGHRPYVFRGSSPGVCSIEH